MLISCCESVIIVVMKKLSEFLKEQFKAIYLHHNEKINDKLLNDCLDEMFPEGKALALSIKDLKRDDKQVNNVYRVKYLPFNTRNEEWLANYVEQVYYRLRSYKIMKRIEQGKYKNNFKRISFAEIQEYVANSKEFAARRDEYEQNVIKTYINLFNDFQNDDFYHSADYKNQFWHEGQDLYHGEESMNVVAYRNNILKATDFLGIDNHNAKVTLEENAVMWRNQLWREDMLCRLLHGVMVNTDTAVIPNLDRKKLRTNGSSAYFHLNWIEDQLYSVYKARDEHYYYNTAENQEIKSLIDDLDIATPNMKISRKKIANLEKSILHLCKQYISEYVKCQKTLELLNSSDLTK